MMVEIITAGTAIRTLFQKNGRRPSHWVPAQAVDQASAHGAKVISRGRASRLPVRISSKDFSDVVSMTNSGIR